MSDLLDIPATWQTHDQVAGISKRSNDKQKSFVPKKNPRVSIRDFKKQKIWFSE